MADRFIESLSSLERGLESAVLRNKVIANNIANIDTPGFQASEVPFGAVLEQEITRTFEPKRTNELHYTWEPVQEKSDITIQSGNKKMRYDENTVDIEHEMNELARNSLYYSALSLKISKQFSRMRIALTEGS